MLDIISIAFACDEPYAKHVAVVMQSIIVATAGTDRYEFHVLTLGLTSLSISRLQKVATDGKATIKVHQIDKDRLAGFPETNYPRDVCLRLMLPEILQEHKKIIYLDADLLVLGSLRELWDLQIGSNAVAAAIDSITIFQGPDLKHLEELQLPLGHLYFNSGVLLLNLVVLREIRLLERAREWIDKHIYPIRYIDQDALNVILAGNLAYFHLRWNLQVPLIAPVQLGWRCSQEHVKAVSNPAIIHYVTNRKPWRKEFKLPYQSLYFKYLAQTPWKDDEIDPFTADLVWQRCKEELEWSRKLVMSKIRRLIGRRFILSDDPN